MKKLSLIFLFLPITIFAQKVALLDTKFKEPIIYTDSVTVQQVTSGRIPVKVENFDTLYANLKYLAAMLKIRQRAKMQSFELRAGSTVIGIQREPHAYGDAYSIIIKSKVDEVSSVYSLADQKNNAHSATKIEKVMAYLKSNKSLFREPYDVHPKLYNVIVITE